MIFRNGSINDLLDFAKGKRLVCCGYNDDLLLLCETFVSYGLPERIDCIAEAGEGQERRVTVKGAEKPLVSLEGLVDQGDNIVLLFTQTMELTDLNRVINSPVYAGLGDVSFYLGGFLLSNPPDYTLPEYDRGGPIIIPKTLHYCWFGGNPMPPLMIRCIESWKTFCPDYEIIEWNEKNYDINQNRFISEAYQGRKWAFVSDFVRMDAVYRHGGVYMDTDVELLKPLDRFLAEPAFCGMEAANFPALSLPFGAVPGNSLVGAFRDFYKTIPFIKPDGEYNLTPCTRYHALMFRDLGLTKENKIQHVGGFTVYPTDVFSPVHPNLVYECYTGNTHAIHYYATSWRTDGENDVKNRDALAHRRRLETLHGGNLYKIMISR